MKLRKVPENADLSYIAPDLRKNAVYAKDILLDPKNPRRGDIPLIAHSLNDHGQQSPLIVYRFPVSKDHPKDGYTVIAGNHRLRAALHEIPNIKKPWKYIAVSEYKGTPTAAQKFALMDNRSSDVAEYDDAVLLGLLKEIETDNLELETGYSQEEMTYLLSRVDLEADDATPELEQIDTTPEKEEVDLLTGTLSNTTIGVPKFHYRFDTLVFPYSDDYGIPDLLPNMLADPPDAPLKTWPGYNHKTAKLCESWEHLWFLNWGYSTQNCPYDRAYLHFYAEDSSFEHIFNNPGKFTANFVAQNLKGIVEPDFSMRVNEPFVHNLWAHYRQRFMARYFQEVGIKVIPNIGGDQEWVYATIPYKPPCVAIQIQSGLSGEKSTRYAIAAYESMITNMLKFIKPDSLIIYATKFGHKLTWDRFPRQLHVIRVSTVQDIRREFYTPDSIRSTTKKYTERGLT